MNIIRGACGHDCPDTCSWIVEVRDGTAEKLVGDPAHPFTRGTLCAKVNHYLDRVYHPDRVLHPLKRVGRKGEARFERVSWDEALGDIASRWKTIVDESGAEAILPHSSAGVQGVIQQSSLDRRLLGSMGCSDLDRKICGAVAAAGLKVTIGTGTGIDPEEIVHSRYIVLWGTNTIVTNLHFWPFVREAQSRGARLVVVDPIRTRTAEAADWHLQIKPGSDAALALAMMHVIVRDDLVDHDYVSRYAVGYDALVERVQQYAPERVAGTVGLPAADIERFAREYATTTPSLLRPLIGIEHHRNGAMQFRALGCLPVLTGAWKHRGGGLARSTHALHFAVLAMDRVEMPEVYKPGVRVLNMRDIGSDLCNRSLTPPVRSLIVYGANPMVSMPNQNRIREGLLREDLFTIVHDLFVTETARYADYVLPATSQIEHLDLSPAWGHLYLAMNRPAIAPRGESLSNTELFRRLAAALGRTEPYLFESDESMLRAALASGHPWLDGITYERLWEEGYARLNRPEGWMPFANGGFATRSGKAELYSEAQREAGLDPLPSAGDIPSGDGLQLITGKQLHYLNSGYNNMERHRRRAGELFIELHAEDAPPPRRRGRRRGGCAKRFRRSARRLPHLRSRPPGHRVDAVRRLPRRGRPAPFRQCAHPGGAHRLGRRQRPLRCVRGGGSYPGSVAGSKSNRVAGFFSAKQCQPSAESARRVRLPRVAISAMSRPRSRQTRSGVLPPQQNRCLGARALLFPSRLPPFSRRCFLEVGAAPGRSAVVPHLGILLVVLPAEPVPHLLHCVRVPAVRGSCQPVPRVCVVPRVVRRSAFHGQHPQPAHGVRVAVIGRLLVPLPCPLDILGYSPALLEHETELHHRFRAPRRGTHLIQLPLGSGVLFAGRGGLREPLPGEPVVRLLPAALGNGDLPHPLCGVHLFLFELLAQTLVLLGGILRPANGASRRDGGRFPSPTRRRLGHWFGWRRLRPSARGLATRRRATPFRACFEGLGGLVACCDGRRFNRRRRGCRRDDRGLPGRRGVSGLAGLAGSADLYDEPLELSFAVGTPRSVEVDPVPHPEVVFQHLGLVVLDPNRNDSLLVFPSERDSRSSRRRTRRRISRTTTPPPRSRESPLESPARTIPPA